VILLVQTHISNFLAYNVCYKTEYDTSNFNNRFVTLNWCCYQICIKLVWTMITEVTLIRLTMLLHTVNHFKMEANKQNKMTYITFNSFKTEKHNLYHLYQTTDKFLDHSPHNKPSRITGVDDTAIYTQFCKWCHNNNSTIELFN